MVSIRFKHLIILCGLIAGSSIHALTPGMRAKIGNLTRDIKNGKLSDTEARKRALGLKISPKDMHTRAIKNLIKAADARGITEILNPPQTAEAQRYTLETEIKPADVIPENKQLAQETTNTDVTTYVKTSEQPEDTETQRTRSELDVILIKTQKDLELLSDDTIAVIENMRKQMTANPRTIDDTLAATFKNKLENIDIRQAYIEEQIKPIKSDTLQLTAKVLADNDATLSMLTQVSHNLRILESIQSTMNLIEGMMRYAAHDTIIKLNAIMGSNKRANDIINNIIMISKDIDETINNTTERINELNDSQKNKIKFDLLYRKRANLFRWTQLLTKSDFYFRYLDPVYNEDIEKATNIFNKTDDSIDRFIALINGADTHTNTKKEDTSHVTSKNNNIDTTPTEIEPKNPDAALYAKKIYDKSTIFKYIDRYKYNLDWPPFRFLYTEKNPAGDNWTKATLKHELRTNLFAIFEHPYRTTPGRIAAYYAVKLYQIQFKNNPAIFDMITKKLTRFLDMKLKDDKYVVDLIKEFEESFN